MVDKVDPGTVWLAEFYDERTDNKPSNRALVHAVNDTAAAGIAGDAMKDHHKSVTVTRVVVRTPPPLGELQWLD